MVFGVKIGVNFQPKSWLVNDWRNTKTPSSTPYSSDVSRYYIRICLLASVLNDLNVQSGDVENAYQMYLYIEKIWDRASPEFEANMVKVYIIIKALYGLRSSGAEFC